MPSRYWLLLIFCQTLWAGSYVAAKVALVEMPPGLVVVLRYGTVSLLLLLWHLYRGMPRFERRDWWLIGIVGAVNFAFAPALQMNGLRYTSAVDVSILIALEPMLTVLGAAILLRERLAKATWIALGMGALGMVVLSGSGFSDGGAEAKLRLFGNLLFLSSLLSEAAFTVSGGRLAPKYSAISLVGAMKLAGFLTASVVYSPQIAAFDFAALTWKSWSAILYLAVGPSVTGYGLWFWIIRKVPVNQVALSLFVQPLVGSAMGYSLLGESIDLHTIAGAALICISLAWWQIRLSRMGGDRAAVVGAES